MPDRRAGPRQGPYVAKQPRTRRNDGGWRRKRSDAGKSRASANSGCPITILLGLLMLAGSVLALRRLP